MCSFRSVKPPLQCTQLNYLSEVHVVVNVFLWCISALISVSALISFRCSVDPALLDEHALDGIRAAGRARHRPVAPGLPASMARGLFRAVRRRLPAFTLHHLQAQQGEKTFSFTKATVIKMPSTWLAKCRAYCMRAENYGLIHLCDIWSLWLKDNLNLQIYT